jgi:hypothetical protein
MIDHKVFSEMIEYHAAQRDAEDAARIAAGPIDWAKLKKAPPQGPAAAGMLLDRSPASDGWRWTEWETADSEVSLQFFALGSGLEIYVSQGGWWWVSSTESPNVLILEFRGTPPDLADPMPRAKRDAATAMRALLGKVQILLGGMGGLDAMQALLRGWVAAADVAVAGADKPAVG